MSEPGALRTFAILGATAAQTLRPIAWTRPSLRVFINVSDMVICYMLRRRFPIKESMIFPDTPNPTAGQYIIPTMI